MMSSGRAFSALGSSRQISAKTHRSELEINYPYIDSSQPSPRESSWSMTHKGLKSVNVNGTFMFENYKIFHLEPHKYDSLKAIELQVINLVEQSSLDAEDGKLETALEYALKSQEILERLKVKFYAQERSSSSLSSKSGSGSISGDQGNNSPAQSKAKDVPASESTQPLTRGVNLFELFVMVNSNLATQLRNNGRCDEALAIYFQLCKFGTSNAASSAAATNKSAFMTSLGQTSSTGMNSAQQQQSLYRFGLNIGNVFFMMGEYQQALKYYRLTLDRLSSTSHGNLRIKLMNNIAITLIKISIAGGKATSGGSTIDLATSRKSKLSQQTTATSGAGDPVTSLNMLLTDNLSQQTMFGLDQQQQRQPSGIILSRRTACNANHHQFGLNLIVNLYIRSDLNQMLATLKSLVAVDICHHYDCVLEVYKSAAATSESTDLTNTLSAKADGSNGADDLGSPSKRRRTNTKSASYGSRTSHVESQQRHGRYSVAGRSMGVDSVSSASSSNDDEKPIAKVAGALPVKAGNNVSGTATRGQEYGSNQRTSDLNEAIDGQRRQGDSMISYNAVTNKQLIGTSQSPKADKPTNDRCVRDLVQVVMKYISTDELEQLIKEKRAYISRALLVTCSLILDLSRQITHAALTTPTSRTPTMTRMPQSQVAAASSAPDTCYNLFAHSASYKSLALDLRINDIIAQLADGQTTLKAAIELMRQLKSQAGPLLAVDEKPSSKATLLSSLERPHSVASTRGIGSISAMNISHKAKALTNALTPMALNNFSWLVYLEGDYVRAKQYVEQSLLMDMANADALVNLANCTMTSDSIAAKGTEKYLQLALDFNEDNQIAIYNSLILARKTGSHYEDLRPPVKKLLRQYYSPGSSDKSNVQQHETSAVSMLKLENTLLYLQTGLILQQSDMLQFAAATFDRLMNKIPSGAKVAPPELLLMASKVVGANAAISVENSDAKSVNEHQTQVTALARVYRRHQYCLPLAERMIALYIDGYDYKSAQNLLKDCIRNRPNQPKWYQMLAECHRRAADYTKAIEIYKQAVELFPSNTNFPKTLIRLTEELGLIEEKEALRERYQL